MLASQYLLDLYIEEYLKNNPDVCEADLRKRLNDVVSNTDTISETPAMLPSSSESEEPSKDKSYTLEEIRLKHKGAYMPWTDDLDLELTVMYTEGITQKKMAEHFGRTTGAISSRIKKLNLNG